MSATAPLAARYDSIDDDAEQPFWLYEPDGNPVKVPATCAGFQVRYWSPVQRGAGSIVVDEHNGRPLILPRTAGPDDFCERVGFKVGRYRLFPVDEYHERLNLTPAQFEITPKMAEARGAIASSSSSSSSAAAPGGELIGQLLAMVRESQAQALASQDRTLEQMSTMYRAVLAMQTEAQKTAATHGGEVVGAVADILRAAGESGTVSKSTALAASAAGAPIVFQSPANANAATSAPGSSSSEAQRGANGAPAAADRGGFGEAAMALLAPLFEKVAPVLAYGAAKKMDVPDEIARDVAGFVRSTAEAASQMLKNDAPAAAAEAGPTVDPLPRAGADLLGHVLRIQGGLPEGDRAWVSRMMASRAELVDALKGSVASISVDEGIAAVRSMRALDAALTTPAERALFDRALTIEVLPGVFRNLFVDASTETAITFFREQALRG